MAEDSERPTDAFGLRRQAEDLLPGKSALSAKEFAELSPEATRQLIHELQVHQIELKLQNEELRQSQVDLDEARERYFDLYDLAPVGYCTLSDQGTILEINLTGALMLGMDRKTLLNRRFSKCVAPDESDTYYQHRRAILQTGIPQAWELRLVRGDGTAFWALLRVTITQEDPASPLLRLVFTDLTEVRRAQLALREVSTAVQQSPVSILITDAEGTILFVNPKFTAVTGYSAEEALGKNPRMLQSGLVSKEVYRDLWETLCAGQVWSGVFHNRKKNGELFWEQALIAPVRDERGVVTSFVAIKEDITERKRTEEALQASEKKWRTLFEILPVGISLLDDQHRIADFNPALARILQLDAEGLRQGSYVKRAYMRADGTPLPREELPSLRATREQVAIPPMQIGVKTEEGQIIWTEVGAAPLAVPGYACVITTTDITAHKRAEDALRESESLLKESQNIAQLGSFVFDFRAGTWESSEVLDGLFGIGPTHVRSLAGWQALLHPDDRTMMNDYLTNDVIGQGQVFDKSYRIIRPADHRERWMWSRAAVERDEKGQPVRLRGTSQDITERMQAVVALRQQQAMLIHTESIAKVGSWAWEVAADIVTWSNEMFHILELDPAAGAPTLAAQESLYDPADFQALKRLVDVTLREGTPYQIELRVIGSGAGAKVCLARARAVLGSDGKVTRLLGSLQDITDRKMAEEALRESKGNLIKAQRFARVGSWTWHIKTNQLEWSEEMYRLFGIVREGFSGDLGEVVAKAVHPDDQEAVEAGNRSVAEKGTPVPLEYRIILPDGTIRFVWAEAGELVLDAEGRPESLTGIVQDITERKRADQALRESEARFVSMAANSPAGFYRFSRQQGGIYYSTRIQDLLGYTPEELLANPMLWHNRIHPDDLAKVDAAMEAARSGLEDIDLIYRIHHKSGKERWFKDTATCRMEADGDLIIDGVAMDITERRLVEVALQESNQLLSLFIAQAPVYAYIKEVSAGQSRVLEASENFKELIGIPGSAMVGKTMSELFPAEVAAKMTADDWAVVTSGEALEFEEVVDGRKYVALKFPIIQGERKLLAGFSIDITERERANQVIADSREKLRVLLSRLQRVQEDERIRISRIVHDELGQLLTELKLDLSWLERRLAEMGRAPELIPMLDKVLGTSELVDTTIETVQRIAAELRPNTLENLGLEATLSQEARRFQERSGIPCTLVTEKAWPKLGTDTAIELFYICREALTNVARHAAAKSVTVSLRMETGGVAAIMEVSDDGIGMAHQEVFGPNSLGLLGMLERASQFGGTIAFEPNLPTGTRVIVTVPCVVTEAPGGADR